MVVVVRRGRNMAPPPLCTFDASTGDKVGRFFFSHIRVDVVVWWWMQCAVLVARTVVCLCVRRGLRPASRRALLACGGTRWRAAVLVVIPAFQRPARGPTARISPEAAWRQYQVILLFDQTAAQPCCKPAEASAVDASVGCCPTTVGAGKPAAVAGADDAGAGGICGADADSRFSGGAMAGAAVGTAAAGADAGTGVGADTGATARAGAIAGPSGGAGPMLDGAGPSAGVRTCATGGSAAEPRQLGTPERPLLPRLELPPTSIGLEPTRTAPAPAPTPAPAPVPAATSMGLSPPPTTSRRALPAPPGASAKRWVAAVARLTRRRWRREYKIKAPAAPTRRIPAAAPPAAAAAPEGDAVATLALAPSPVPALTEGVVEGEAPVDREAVAVTLAWAPAEAVGDAEAPVDCEAVVASEAAAGALAAAAVVDGDADAPTAPPPLSSLGSGVPGAVLETEALIDRVPVGDDESVAVSVAAGVAEVDTPYESEAVAEPVGAAEGESVPDGVLDAVVVEETVVVAEADSLLAEALPDDVAVKGVPDAVPDGVPDGLVAEAVLVGDTDARLGDADADSCVALALAAVRLAVAELV